MSEQKPLCPYCGAEMKIMVHEFYDGAYCSGYAYCPKCGSYGPSLAGDISKEQLHDEVKAAALRRPLQKPLTAEEMTARVFGGHPVYVEEKRNDDAFNGYALAEDAEDAANCMMDEYGTGFRCWASRPTDEERAAAPWEK